MSTQHTKQLLALFGSLFMILILLVVPFMVVLAKPGPATTPAPAPAPSPPPGPIKIGLLAPLTGPFSSFAREIKLGAQLAFEQVGWKVADRRIELIVEDSEAKPDVGLQKVRKLVESDRVHILTGFGHSGVVLAARDYVVAHKIPVVIGFADVPAITKEKGSKYIFRTSWTSTQNEIPLMPYVYQKLGIRTIVIVSADFVVGHEKADGVKAAFEKVGGKVIEEIYPAFGTTDFSPYLTKIKGMKGVDAVWVFEPGSSGIHFVRQWGEYAVGKKIRLIGSGGTFEESNIRELREAGDAVVGVICTTAYHHSIDTPQNRRFVEAYKKISGGKPPETGTESSYDAALLIIEGIKATKGEVEDVPKLLEAFKTAKIDAPRGPFRLDKNQNPVCDMVVLRIEKVAGNVVRTVIDRVPEVGQD